MRRLSGLVGALVLASAATSVYAAEATVFITSSLSNATTPAAAVALGVAPIVPRAAWDGGDLDGIPNNTIPIQIWLSINPEGPNYGGEVGGAGYQLISSGGYDIAGDNNDAKGSGLNLFRTFNTAAAQRRWDSQSATANGVAGGSGYLWQGTAFDQGARSGAVAGPLAAPAGPEMMVGGRAIYLIASGDIAVNAGGFTDATNILDSFFDVFFELRNGDYGAGPIEPVAQVEWGFDGPDFFGSNAVNPGIRSPLPQLRIEVPEPATMALLGLGGLLLRRRR